MGMDLSIYRTKQKYDRAKALGGEWEHEEIYYARKFWALYYVMSCRKNADNCDYVLLDKDDATELAATAVSTPDYWDSFETVPILLDLVYHWEKYADEGWLFYFCCDW